MAELWLLLTLICVIPVKPCPIAGRLILSKMCEFREQYALDQMLNGRAGDYGGRPVSSLYYDVNMRGNVTGVLETFH